MKNMIETYVVDSFTDTLFKGNPAGVCILEQALTDDKMLAIANELGFSETAFIQQLDKANKYSIRFFSPKMEIPLCGHATLAASKVLFSKDSDVDMVHFVSVEALDLLIRRKGEAIIMEFPVYDMEPANANAELLAALGIEHIINCRYFDGFKILFLEIASSQDLRALSPDFNALVKSHQSINGVLISAPSAEEQYDFESRYFWPWSGTNEDPVTGATHTLLTKYWSERLGKKKMKAFQCSERTGFMEVELIGNNKLTITSQAQIVLEGQLSI